MKGLLSKFFGGLKTGWSELSLVKKIIGVSVFALLVVGVIAAVMVGSKPQSVAVLTQPITDQDLLDKISMRLDQENIPYTLKDGRFLVDGKTRARQVRSVLVREQLLPTNTDPWELFDVSRWTQTDFERNVNLRRSITRQVTQHIEALDDIDSAQVNLVMPEETLFSTDKKPVSASVILNIKPGSDFRENTKKIQGVQQLILLAVEGLTEENLTISDSSGVRLNDFKNLADYDRLTQTEREIKIRNAVENTYKEAIYKSLADIYTPDRVRIININVDIDFNKKTRQTTENFPITVRPDNPETPYDESEVTLAIPRSEQTTLQKYQGTGFNPQGPPGVEGQTPPSYKALDGIVGDWDNRTTAVNNEINQKVTNEERTYDVVRVTASVALDGTWQFNYNPDGTIVLINNKMLSRTYFPISNQDLQKALSLVRDAVGYSVKRGDSVSVENLQFDRLAQFAQEDAKYLRQLRNKKIVVIGLLILLAAIVIFFIVRLIVRMIEEHKERKEARLAEQYRRMREQQIADLAQKKDIAEESELDRMVREAGEVMKQRPAEIVHLIRAWVEGR